MLPTLNHRHLRDQVGSCFGVKTMMQGRLVFFIPPRTVRWATMAMPITLARSGQARVTLWLRRLGSSVHILWREITHSTGVRAQITKCTPLRVLSWPRFLVWSMGSGTWGLSIISPSSKSVGPPVSKIKVSDERNPGRMEESWKVSMSLVSESWPATGTRYIWVPGAHVPTHELQST